MTSATGQKKISDLKNKSEWYPLNRMKRRWYDNIPWGQVIVCVLASVCLIATLVHHLRK